MLSHIHACAGIEAFTKASMCQSLLRKDVAEGPGRPRRPAACSDLPRKRRVHKTRRFNYRCNTQNLPRDQKRVSPFESFTPSLSVTAKPSPEASMVKLSTFSST